ncbi:hypothetical protein J2Z76_002395 [Sedimentibacter acidaminivorans]|uniref:Uncharacterized protein n=1 Tax=Sedimentibacter acidaminivorans TaxID=913099 RepID=A0ABS4GFQ7_9FIRM|nr:hypothetical protein [Sedimentibacter acidaminivorans]MBP1926526.1 hypothetical protein [Sedimentibacter acidaminivorans]
MKIKNLESIIILLVLLNVFTLFKLNNVKNSIERQMQQNEHEINNLENNINNIYTNVDAKLKKQASVLDSYDVQIRGELNPNNYTVPVTLTITPKEYSDELTATLQLNNKNIPMQKKGTSFKCTFDVYIFDDFKLKIILEQNGIQKIESIEEYSKLQYKYLLDIFGGFSGKESYSSGIYKFDGDISLNFGNSQNNSPIKASLGKYLNGTIVSEQEVELSDHMDIPVNDSIELNANDKFMLCVNVQDKYGINYKYVVMLYEIDSKGKSVNIRPEWSNGSIIEISDKNGNILYTPEYILVE